MGTSLTPMGPPDPRRYRDYERIVNHFANEAQAQGYDPARYRKEIDDAARQAISGAYDAGQVKDEDFFELNDETRRTYLSRIVPRDAEQAARIAPGGAVYEGADRPPDDPAIVALGKAAARGIVTPFAQVENTIRPGDQPGFLQRNVTQGILRPDESYGIPEALGETGGEFYGLGKLFGATTAAARKVPVLGKALERAGVGLAAAGSKLPGTAGKVAAAIGRKAPEELVGGVAGSAALLGPENVNLAAELGFAGLGSLIRARNSLRAPADAAAAPPPAGGGPRTAAEFEPVQQGAAGRVGPSAEVQAAGDPGLGGHSRQDLLSRRDIFMKDLGSSDPGIRREAQARVNEIDNLLGAERGMGTSDIGLRRRAGEAAQPIRAELEARAEPVAEPIVTKKQKKAAPFEKKAPEAEAPKPASDVESKIIEAARTSEVMGSRHEEFGFKGTEGRREFNILLSDMRKRKMLQDMRPKGDKGPARYRTSESVPVASAETKAAFEESRKGPDPVDEMVSLASRRSLTGSELRKIKGLQSTKQANRVLSRLSGNKGVFDRIRPEAGQKGETIYVLKERYVADPKSAARRIRDVLGGKAREARLTKAGATAGAEPAKAAEAAPAAEGAAAKIEGAAEVPFDQLVEEVIRRAPGGRMTGADIVARIGGDAERANRVIAALQKARRIKADVGPDGKLAYKVVDKGQPSEAKPSEAAPTPSKEGPAAEAGGFRKKRRKQVDLSKKAEG